MVPDCDREFKLPDGNTRSTKLYCSQGCRFRQKGRRRQIKTKSDPMVKAKYMINRMRQDCRKWGVKYPDSNAVPAVESMIKNILGMPCPITGLKIESPADCSLDHIIPLSRGGESVIGNLQVLSIKGNRIKHDLTMGEWGELIERVYNLRKGQLLLNTEAKKIELVV